ncbi:mitochondrial 37S ribosomal protein uS11m [Colletotrichum truncatum]|uniref:37S ribosomal protein S18, mitochondrial n=1 Tax=Colletotrichum truncatum TaxID=5467 RepID=A0ACC3YWD5_COLTU|nr:37S ribosomal protein S18, mitochondrial [Colletotrichum truncatum]KAF6787401.1 37S ribosomal protein S18, mitochondrial [Colletotrichum truncatum]
MASAPTARLLARSIFQNAARPATVARCSPILLRPFSQTAAPRADAPESKKGGQELLAAMYGSSKPANQTEKQTSTGSSAGLSQQSLLLETLNRASGNKGGLGGLDDLVPEQEDLLEPYHMHVYSHKHNCHVTVTKPDRGAIISLSTGNIGFKKSKRKSYDAAYQLTAYVLERLNYAGWHKKINKLEVVLRGFGAGRDAAVKVLMAPEGKIWRSKVVRVADSTRLKFGGTRSKNPRRV